MDRAILKPQCRDYQATAVAAVLAARDRRPILVAPTGSGKTVMAVAAATQIGGRTLWLAHRSELISQAAQHLTAAGAWVGIIKAGIAPNPLAPVQVASVQTLVRRDLVPADMVVIDECHHVAADTYRTILDAYPRAVMLGLTATPFRLDGRGLGDLFGTIIVAATPRELCERGILHAPRVWAPSAPDLRGVRVAGGDYNLSDLAERVIRKKLIGDIIRTWRRHADGRRTVAFAVNIEHSRAIVAEFKAAGIPAEHIDGRIPTDQRSEILGRLRAGETHVVSNCMLLTEGWDLPALECAIIARPTASLALHLQMIGRVMRACHGKDGAIVLDHAGNHHVHGLVTRQLAYSLDSNTKVGASEPLGLRRCRQCGLMYEMHVTACPECKWVPEIQRAGEVIGRCNGELVEFDDSDFGYRAEVWRLLEAEREAAGYQPGWSWHRYVERFGVNPVLGLINGHTELIDPATATMVEKQAVYAHLLRVARRRGFADGWASHRYRKTFGVWPSGFVKRVRLMETCS